MNGAHAELFTYVLHSDLSSDQAKRDISPLSLQSYQFQTISEIQPSVLLVTGRFKDYIYFVIESAKLNFCIRTSQAALTNHPKIHDALRDKVSFAADGDSLIRLVPRDQIHQVLQQLAQTLAALAP